MLRRASEDDHAAIIGLIDRAAEWLRTKNTDQWAQPRPSMVDRNQRIMRDLRAGKTWVIADGPALVATITADPDGSPAWPTPSRSERAVYVCRLVVSRAHAGEELGGAFLDWAGLQARQRSNAQWVRVHVWTTNQALHAYYRDRGFEFYGLSEQAGDGYPSAALFQKPTSGIQPPDHPLLRPAPDDRR